MAPYKERNIPCRFRYVNIVITKCKQFFCGNVGILIELKISTIFSGRQEGKSLLHYPYSRLLGYFRAALTVSNPMRSIILPKRSPFEAFCL